MGVSIEVNGLMKFFGFLRIWEDVMLMIFVGEVSVLLGLLGIGKLVFLKFLIGFLWLECGLIIIDGIDIIECLVKEFYEICILFGVLFQDGVLFGLMNFYDNIVFFLCEYIKKKESEICDIVMEKLVLVGLGGDEKKFFGEIFGGMCKCVGLVCVLVFDLQIIFCDEFDLGLDLVCIVYLSQLIMDINVQIDVIILIVMYNINIVCIVLDNMGMLFCKYLVMFGLWEVLFISDELVVWQFFNGWCIGLIGMFEEKDEVIKVEEQVLFDVGYYVGGVEEIEGVLLQISVILGMLECKVVVWCQVWVCEMLYMLFKKVQVVIFDDFEGMYKYVVYEIGQ